MCGAGASSGNCYGIGAPAGTVGVTGNIYYDTTNADCYYRQAGSWKTLNDASLSSVERALALYGQSRKPPGVISPDGENLTSPKSYATCQAVNDSDYGYKRLLREREYIASTGLAVGHKRAQRLKPMRK